MAQQLRLEISESASALKEQLHQQRDSRLRERVQAIYLLKSAQAKTTGQLAALVGRSPATIGRWLRSYRQGGMAALLALGYERSGRVSVLPEAARAGLQARLEEPDGFASYGAVQEWLREHWGLALKYKTVHQIVRYPFKAKLKRPRPCSIHQSREELVGFKKNCRDSSPP